MKTKNLILSLIFPVICFAYTLILLFTELSLYVKHTGDIIMCAVGVVISAIPAASVIFAKTDISHLFRYQAIFAAAEAASAIVGAVLINMTLVVVGVCFILVPLVLTAVNAVIYAKALERDMTGRPQKWFTAFLSTPSVWALLTVVAAYLSLMINGLDFSSIG